MLKTMIAGALALTTFGTGATAIVLNSNQEQVPIFAEATIDTSIEYSVEQMLTLAIEDEYLAKATYTKLLELFPDEQKLSRLIAAEQKHIDALLPLFETYGVVVPSEILDLTLSFESFQEAALSIADGELANIAMYQHFLAQPNTPEDVKEVFGYLLAGSMRHLQAAQVAAIGKPNSDNPRANFAKRYMAGMRSKKANQFGMKRGNK